MSNFTNSQKNYFFDKHYPINQNEKQTVENFWTWNGYWVPGPYWRDPHWRRWRRRWW